MSMPTQACAAPSGDAVHCGSSGAARPRGQGGNPPACGLLPVRSHPSASWRFPQSLFPAPPSRRCSAAGR
eukprot:5037966-Pyramimonas_sp.AAC.1